MCGEGEISADPARRLLADCQAAEQLKSVKHNTFHAPSFDDKSRWALRNVCVELL